MKRSLPAKRKEQSASPDASARPAPLMPDLMFSYAQNFEDALLHRIFSGVEDGFYIDIGASDPVIGSVTKIFYDRGWSGINVEPGTIFERLAAARPRDTNLKLAVLDRKGEVDFVEDMHDRGMSHIDLLSPGGARHAHRDSLTYRVPCDSLNQIVAQHAAGRLIHFIKIDAAGCEDRIVNSTDWKVVRPQVLVIQAVAPWTNQLVSDKWEPTLLANGYVRGYFDGLNLFFVRSEDSDLLAHFDLPLNVLDRFERYDPRSAKALEQANLELRSELLYVRHMSARLVAERNRLESARDDAAHKDLEIARLEEQVRALEPLADKYDLLANQLQAADAPRAIRMVLPAARALRATSRMFGYKLAPAAAVPAATRVDRARRALAKILVRPIYVALLRPLVRPIAWRMRAFLLEPVHRLSGQLDAIAREVAAARPRPRDEELSPELLKSIEALVLTVAAQAPVGEQLKAITRDLGTVRVSATSVQQQLEDLKSRHEDLSPGLLKSVETLLLTITSGPSVNSEPPLR